MADDSHWMEKAFAKNKGALHKNLGIAAGKKIPAGKLAAAAKKGGKVGERARAAENARRATIREGAAKKLYGK